MPASKKLETYPDWMFDIANYFRDGGDVYPMKCKDHGTAINLRQRFYSFRNLLIQEQGSHMWSSINGVQIRIEGEDLLMFESVDNSDIGRQIKEDIARLRAEKGLDSGIPQRRSTDHSPTPELSANTTDETSQSRIPSVGQMDDSGTNAILNRYGFED